MAKAKTFKAETPVTSTKKPAKGKAKASTPKSTISFDFSGASITADIASFKKGKAAQETLAHALGLKCICQIMSHRNSDFANRFLAAMGTDGKSMYRTTSFVKWLEAFAPVKLKTTKDKDTGAVTRTFKIAAEDDATWLASAKAYAADPVKFVNLLAFWVFDPEIIVYKPVNFIALIEQAVKRAEGATVYPKGHKKEGQPLSPEDKAKNNLIGLVQAKALIATIKGSISHTSSASH